MIGYWMDHHREFMMWAGIAAIILFVYIDIKITKWVNK